MKNVFLISIVFCFIFSGCTWLSETVAPVNPESGKHELSQTAKIVTDTAGPYGQAAGTILLLVLNGIQWVKNKKTESGLISTVKAINDYKNDLLTKADVEKLKQYLSSAHNAAGVTLLINNLLAKVKSKVS